MVRYCGTGLPISARANHHLHCTHYSFFSFTYTNGATSYTIQYLQECHFAASHCGVASQCPPHTTPLTLLLHVVALAYKCNHISDITPNTHTHIHTHQQQLWHITHTHTHHTHTTSTSHGTITLTLRAASPHFSTAASPWACTCDPNLAFRALIPLGIRSTRLYILVRSVEGCRCFTIWRRQTTTTTTCKVLTLSCFWVQVNELGHHG